MSTSTKILLGCVVAAFILGLSLVAALFGVKNTCVSHEKGIEAQYEQNQNNLASYINKVMDMVQVPKMAVGHIKEVAEAAIKGRYGEQGSQALFQAIVENNPSVDAGLYRNIQQAMEAGRESFSADQKTLIDKCRVYDTYTEQAPQSFFVGFFGYPKYDRTQCKPVINDDTVKAFETKRTGPLQIQ